MARANHQLLAFNRGEISKTALARIDVAKLALAAECQLNWEPKVLGPMGLRPGLEHMGSVLNDSPCQPIEFIYSKFDTAMLELTANQLRVWIDDVLLARPAVTTVISDPNFAGGGTWVTSDTTAGCSTTIGSGALVLTATALGGLARARQTVTVGAGNIGVEHGLRIVVSNGPVTLRLGTNVGLSDVMPQTVLDTGTHSLSFVPSVTAFLLQIDSTDQWAKAVTSCAIEAGGIVQVPTPWGAADLPNLRTHPSGDIVYVAAYGLQQYKIERRGARPGARGWSIVQYRSGNGPFHEGADIVANFTANQSYGNAAITSDKPFFRPGHVGALIRMFTPGQTNVTVLGAANVYSQPTLVSGVQGDRVVGINVSGTWVGQISLQRSLTGPEEGFVTVPASDVGWASTPTLTGNFGIAFYDNGQTEFNPPNPNTQYDNVDAWYRIGFEAGNYTSGSATVFTAYGGGGGWGIARIRQVVSPTNVVVEILEPFSATSATSNWMISDWCAELGWPTSVTIQEGRLWWFSGGEISIAGSQSDNYTGYAEEDSQGQPLGDSGAILEAFGDGPSDSVNWALGLTRLLCGREMSVGSIRSSSFDEPLTPTNFSVKDCATQGAARLRAVKIDKRGLFVQESGRRVYELLYDPQGFDYSAHDVTRLNIDIGKPGFVDIDVARQPDTAAYLPRAEGQCAVLLDDADDEVSAWWRIQTLGVIENVRVLPAADGPENRVYFVVRRVINGVTRRFFEKLALRDNCVGGSINQLLDCHTVFQGSSVSSITLPHLPNTQVSVWADGAFAGIGTTDGSGFLQMPDKLGHKNIVAGLAGGVVNFKSPDAPVSVMSGLSAYEGLPVEVFADQQPADRMSRVGTLVVSGGQITLPNGWLATTIVVFAGYVAPFQSAKLGYSAELGSPLTQKKKVDHLGLLLFDTGAEGIQHGQRFDLLNALPLIEGGQTVPSATVWSEYDEPSVELPGEWDSDARLCLLAIAPTPAMVGAAVVSVGGNDK